MSKITFMENKHKTSPKFKDSNVKGYYCFGVFNGTEYNAIDSRHYRQVIDIDKETAIELIELLKQKFRI